MNKEVQILMVDDDEEDFIIIRDLVSEIKHYKYKLEWISSYEKGLNTICENKYDIYLIDYRLGADNGLELMREAISCGCDAPFILLTGQNDIEIDKEALKGGAADFLLKGTISSRHLGNSIRYSIEHARITKELKTLNSSLEKRVKDRTLILEEAIAELEKTKKNLKVSLEKEKELNELKSRFVSIASHEFRTPLATIQSSLILVQKYSKMQDLEKQDKHISKIKSSINNLTDILNDFLSVSKLEEGKVENIVEEFDLQLFVSEIISEMQSITKKGQKIAYTHAGNAIVMLDKKSLKNILINLISNAIKFSPEEESIDIASEIKKTHVLISVKDKGIGITKEDQKHLFERFFRGQNATHIQGTGLGLHIVSKYVELMNGSAQITSEENKGTTFTITIPQ